MKKEDFLTLVVYAVMIVIALFVGLQVIKPSFDNTHITGNGQYVFAIASLIAGLLLNVILMETGHVLGALIGGYAILSVNILGLCFYKSKGRWKIGFKSFEGLTGETKIMPRKTKTNPKWFLWGATIIFIIEGIVLFTLYAVLDSENPVKYASLIVVAVGGMITFYNVIPMKLDTINDGYRLTLITKGINVDAFNELMRIEQAISENRKPENIHTYEEITTLTVQVNLHRIYELLDENRFTDAEAIIDNILKNPKNINDTAYGRVVAQKTYLRLLTSPLEEAKAYYTGLDGKARKFLSNDLSMESLRAYILVSGIVEESEHECRYAFERMPSAVKRMGDPLRIEAEKRLFGLASDKVKEAHPSWDFLSK